MNTHRNSKHKQIRWAFLFIVAWPFFCLAQDKSSPTEQKSFIIRIKTGYFNYGFLNNGLNLIQDQKRMFRLTTELEGWCQVPLSDHWRFSLGASYLRTPMAFENMPLIVSFNQATNSFVIDEEGKFKYVGHDLKTTINLQGYLNKKHTFFVGLGIGQMTRLFTTNFSEFKDETGEIVMNKSIFPSYRTSLIGAIEVGYTFKCRNQNELLVSLCNSSNISSYFNRLTGGYVDFNVALAIGYKFDWTHLTNSPPKN